jgi:hypothetical protein
MEDEEFDKTIQDVDLVCITDWDRPGLVSFFSVLLPFLLTSVVVRVLDPAE